MRQRLFTTAGLILFFLTLPANASNTITVGTGPGTSILVGTKLYVNNFNANSISVIDTTTNTGIATIPVGTNPDFASLVGTKLYVNNSGANTVSVIDTTTNTVTSPLV